MNQYFKSFAIKETQLLIYIVEGHNCVSRFASFFYIVYQDLQVPICMRHFYLE